MAVEPPGAYEFGPFRVEPGERQLRRRGTLVPLTPKAFDTLLVLLGAPGKAISKHELLERVWPDTNVADATLAQNIFALRKALGENQYIETVPKFGYRFASPVRALQPEVRKLTLVVLPFENLSGDSDQEYFSDGLTDEMIAQLSRLNPHELAVIARTSAMKYKQTRKSVAEIGRELRVGYVVEGSVRRAGERVRVTAQLIEVAGQTPVWSDIYERRFEDILGLQNDIAQSIAGEIKIKLTPGAARRLTHAPAISPQAHEAYLRGRYFWNKRTEDALQKGLEYFQQAIDYEPRYAAAYDGVSDSYVMLACRGVLPARETFQLARTAVLTALEIDSTLGEAYATLAHVRLHDWDWTNLDEDFRHALELNPGHAFAYYWYSEYLMAMCRTEEAVAMVKTAHEMDPLSSVLSSSLGMMLFLGRRYDEAIGYLGTALDLDGDHFLLHFRLGLVYLQKQLWPAAIEEMRCAVSRSGRSTETLTGLAQAYAAAGMPREMQEVVDEIDRQPMRYVSPYNMSRIYAAAGDANRAFQWLERAYQERNPDLIELRTEPAFDTMRPDERFGDLLRRVGWRVEPVP